LFPVDNLVCDTRQGRQAFIKGGVRALEGDCSVWLIDFNSFGQWQREKRPVTPNAYAK
jgi:hypothetical protein